MLSKSKMRSRFLTKNVPNPPRDFDYSPSALLSRLNSKPYQGRTTKHLNEQDDVPTIEKITLLSLVKKYGAKLAPSLFVIFILFSPLLSITYICNDIGRIVFSASSCL